jgi:hypothetical protein
MFELASVGHDFPSPDSPESGLFGFSGTPLWDPLICYRNQGNRGQMFLRVAHRTTHTTKVCSLEPNQMDPLDQLDFHQHTHKYLLRQQGRWDRFGYIGQ